MAEQNQTVKVPIGMRTSTYYPITAEPASAHPTYGTAVDMGAAVKGYLSVTTSSAEIRGDDVTLIQSDSFVSGQLDVETTLSDLSVNAKIYGHTYSEENGEISSGDDQSPNGGYSFIEPILKSDKTISYRASVFPKVSATASGEKQEADTKPSGDLNPKMNAVTFKVMEDNAGTWRQRKDFPSEELATAWIKTFFGVA